MGQIFERTQYLDKEHISIGADKISKYTTIKEIEVDY
jgi:hypothetical protein